MLKFIATQTINNNLTKSKVLLGKIQINLKSIYAPKQSYENALLKLSLKKK